MSNENKLKNLHQFLTKKHSTSSKKISLNIRSETTSPSSYNERNYSTKSKHFTNEINNKSNQIPLKVGFIKSNTIDKNSYNNINLLTNLEDEEDNNTFDSFSKNLNKSKYSNTSKISAITVLKSTDCPLYDKPLFFHIMKYFTRKGKNKKMKIEEIDFFLAPMIKIINYNRKNIINIKNLKKELDEKNSLKFGKKGKNNYSSINHNNDENYLNKIYTNENRNCVGIEDGFNLTFGKNSNKIENYPQSNNGINKKNKSNSNNKKLTNFNININNYKNNIYFLKNEKKKNDHIDNNPQSQRNNVPPILISEKIIKNRKIIDNNNSINKEESTPSFLKENKKLNSKTSAQFKPRHINLIKNGINLDDIKLNNPILQNLLSRKKHLLKNKIKKIEKESSKKGDILFDSSRLKVMDKKINIKEENKIKNNKNINLNYFNRDYSTKKN